MIKCLLTGMNDHVVVVVVIVRRIHRPCAAESYIHTWQHTAIIWWMCRTSTSAQQLKDLVEL